MALLTEVQKNYGKLKNYVNGEWVDSTSGKYIDIENPTTGEIIGQVPMSSADETKAAIEAAQEAWWSWRETPPITRARVFFKVCGALSFKMRRRNRSISKGMTS